jgi:Ala-tRNA(Pro) deacylase
MAIAEKLRELLENEKVNYQIMQHSVAYTASEIAGAQHIPGKQVIKAVLIKSDNQYVLCVLPSVEWVDFEKLKRVLGSKEIKLASEAEIAKLFPDYEVGAEPPFAEGIKIFVDKNLEGNDEIVFNAGTHTDMVKVKYKDFARLAKPTVADFGKHI